MSSPSPVDSVAVVVGAACGYAVESLARDRSPRARTRLAALGLVTAAAIYPAARTDERKSAAATREATALAACAGLSALALRRGGLTGRALVAAGWAVHPVFDATHDDSHGRLPRWYPALCAGYDLAMAAGLLRPGRR